MFNSPALWPKERTPSRSPTGAGRRRRAELLLEFAEHASGVRSPRACRKTADELAPFCGRGHRITEALRVERPLIEQAFFVLRILPLRRLIVLERFARISRKPKGIPKISAHVGIIDPLGNGSFVVRDRFAPLTVVVIPVAQFYWRCVWRQCSGAGVRRDRWRARRCRWRRVLVRPEP